MRNTGLEASSSQEILRVVLKFRRIVIDLVDIELVIIKLEV